MKNILYGIAIFFVAAGSANAEMVIRATDSNGNEKTNFAVGDSVYVTGECHLINTDNNPRIYVTPDQNWVGDESLSDVSGGIEVLTNSANGNVPTTLIWGNAHAGSYDVVIDTNNNYRHDAYEGCIDGISMTGFTVGTPVAPPPPPAPLPVPPPPPVAVSTPPPPPPPPSSAFSNSDRVTVPTLANVRSIAGGTIIGKQEKDAEGEVTGGPSWTHIDGVGFWFWRVNFDSGADGWVAEKTIKKAPTKTPPPPVEPPPTEVSPPPAAIPPPPAPETQSAQVYTPQTSSGLGGIGGAIVIGLAIFLGFIAGSFIIARAIRK